MLVKKSIGYPSIGYFEHQTGINSKRRLPTDHHRVIGHYGNRLSRMPKLLDVMRAFGPADLIEDPDEIGRGKNQGSTMTE